MTQDLVPTFPPPPLPGSLLVDRYRTGAVIGRGATGLVIEAVDVRTGRDLAVKWLYPDGWGLGLAERYLREAEIMRAIRHPNVVELLDVIERDQGVCIVFERLRGETLQELLDRQRPLTMQAAISLMLPTLEGVAAAHALGIIHRDLKPANVFLASTGHGAPTPKVLDFGYGKFTCAEGPSLTKTGIALGTVSYMGPEQLFESKRVDARSDVFSLGVMLYEMLVGELPFSAPSLPALAFTIMRGQYPKLAERLPEVDARLDEVVSRALLGDARQRFNSAGEMLTALSPLRPANGFLAPA